jgi:hypothetical protein
VRRIERWRNLHEICQGQNICLQHQLELRGGSCLSSSALRRCNFERTTRLAVAGERESRGVPAASTTSMLRSTGVVSLPFRELSSAGGFFSSFFVLSAFSSCHAPAPAVPASRR